MSFWRFDWNRRFQLYRVGRNSNVNQMWRKHLAPKVGEIFMGHGHSEDECRRSVVRALARPRASLIKENALNLMSSYYGFSQSPS